MSNTKFLTKKFIYKIYDRLIDEENNWAFMTMGLHKSHEDFEQIKNPNKSITPQYEKTLDLFADLEYSIAQDDWEFAEQVVKDILCAYPFLVFGTKEIRQGRKRIRNNANKNLR